MTLKRESVTKSRTFRALISDQNQDQDSLSSDRRRKRPVGESNLAEEAPPYMAMEQTRGIKADEAQLPRLLGNRWLREHLVARAEFRMIFQLREFQIQDLQIRDRITLRCPLTMRMRYHTTETPNPSSNPSPKSVILTLTLTLNIG